MSHSKSIIIARSSMHTQSGLIVRPIEGVALCLLVVDRSGSMKTHGDTPRTAANELIGTLRTAEGADRSLFGLYTFNHEVTLDIAPVLAKRAPDLAHYRAEGDTALFKAVQEALAVGLEFRGFAVQQYRTEARVAITVISDGADTASQGMGDSCREHAEIARLNGFNLQAIGLGIDGKKLAQVLGFDPGYAHTEAASVAGFTQSVKHTSASFTGTMSFPQRPTPTPPSGSS